MKIKVEDLESNMMGIYKITYPNGKIYIGLSTDIKRRMKEHNFNSHQKLQPCDAAIKKYGKIEEIEILEFVNNSNDLEQKEKYWIQYFNSNNRDIGYNLTPGGDAFHLFGENNINASFSNEEVLDIRKRRFNGERKKDVYKDYQDKSFSSFEHIWLGRGYSDIGKEYIIPTNSKTRQQYSSEANQGLKNGRAKCTREEILDIRKRYDNGETISSIKKDYLHKISHSTIRRIALRESYASVN